MALLEVEDLVVEFTTDDGVTRAVDGVSLVADRGQTVAVVGESGCGKSVTAMSIMRLIPSPPGRVRSGKILYDGRDLLTLSEAQMRAVRGNRISMIFQEPMTSLNPVFTVGDQIGESVRLHQGLNKREAEQKAVQMLGKVGIPSPEERVRSYPHELSGGMRQRVMIAMALVSDPDLLIADEPTTALDVTIQAQIMELMQALQDELGMSIILITHDLGVVAETADIVQVMYAGKVVERAEVGELFAHPRHPYTMGLLRSVPGYVAEDEQPPVGEDGRPRLRTIPGLVPDLKDLGPGCRFADRCENKTDDCALTEPMLERAAPEGRAWACFHPLGVAVGERA